jgi:hypothetical protein
MAFAYFGGTLEPSWTNTPSRSRIYPVGHASVYRMEKPDGGTALFCLNGDVLVGDKPWVGKRDKNCINVWADPAHTGGKLRTGYTFVNGLLRHMEIDGAKYDFPAGNPFADRSSDSLFPEVRKREMSKGSSGDIWNSPNGNRIRLWFANPNCAGLFFVQLALLFIAPLAVPRTRKWCLARSRVVRFGVFSACSLLALASFYGLLRTGSRGALVGFGVGLVAMAIPSLRFLLTRRGLVLTLFAALAFVGLVFVSGQGRHLVDTCRKIDASNALRLKIAKASTMLLADAPFGWHGGEVPVRKACLNWYVLDEPRTIRTHLMTIAELGWFGGGAYLAGWFVLLGLGVLRLSKRDPLAMAVFASFFVAGFFNPVYRQGELWILPSVAALACVWTGQPWKPVKRSLSLVGGSVAASALVIAGLVVLGAHLARPTKASVKSCGAATFVNGSTPSVWIVEDVDVLGGFGSPGREILTQLGRRPDYPGLGYVYSVIDLPKEVETLVLPGRAAEDYLSRLRVSGEAPCRAQKVVFLSPKARPDDVPESLRRQSDVRWFVGSLVALRESSAYKERRPWVRICRGCELYPPNWLDLVVAHETSSDSSHPPKKEKTK